MTKREIMVRAHEIARTNGKLWYDLTSGRFESKGLSERAVERITKALGRVV